MPGKLTQICGKNYVGQVLHIFCEPQTGKLRASNDSTAQSSFSLFLPFCALLPWCFH